MGESGSGKSKLVNFLGNEKLAEFYAKKLSCTIEFKLYEIINCLNLKKRGRKLNVIETIGLLDTGNLKILTFLFSSFLHNIINNCTYFYYSFYFTFSYYFYI